MASRIGQNQKKGNHSGSTDASSFPVWVGNLHERVSEDMLRERFSSFGAIISCIIMKDDSNRSKNFGYVNFSNKSDAERAATKLSGFKFNGKPIKTKAPSALKKEGHLKKKTDYRVITDCSFFMSHKICTKGDKVPQLEYIIYILYVVSVSS